MRVLVACGDPPDTCKLSTLLSAHSVRHAHPQALSHIVTLIFGALLLDSGFDLPYVRSVYDKHFRPFIDRYCLKPGAIQLNPQSMFHDLVQRKSCRKYDIIAEEDVDTGLWSARSACSSMLQSGS